MDLVEEKNEADLRCSAADRELEPSTYGGGKKENITLIRVFPIPYVAVIPLMDLFVSKIKINAWTLPFSLLMNSLETLTICCSDRPGCEGQQKALTKIMEPPARF